MRITILTLALVAIITWLPGCTDETITNIEEETSTFTDEQTLQKSGDDDGTQRGIGFHFLSVSDAGVDGAGVHHRIAMTGTGKINRRHVVGDGSFNHFDQASAIPKTILATGTWRTKRLISFTKTEHPNNPWGFILSGILKTEVLLFPEGGPHQGIPATLTVACNIGGAGIFTDLPEGYFLETADGLLFEPATFPGGFPFGITAFSVDPESDD